MTRADFEARRAPVWDELDKLLWRASRGRRSRHALSPEDAARLPRLYRAASEDLALTRHRGYGVDLADRLNDLCMRGYQVLHGRRTGILRRALAFMAVGFPRLVRANGRVSSFACLLFFGPFFAIIAAAFVAPEWVYGALGDDMRIQLESSFSPNDEPADLGRDFDSDLQMFGFYVQNNVGIAFRTFAGGILLGLGSIFFLLFNGIVLGAAFGYAFIAEFDRSFMAFTAGHGAPELIGIALSGAAGLKLGLAILKPGRRTRALALRDEGRDAVRIALGAGGMITFAALIEAFWSATEMDPVIKYWVGGSVWVGTIAWLLLAGRGVEPSPDHEELRPAAAAATGTLLTADGPRERGE